MLVEDLRLAFKNIQRSRHVVQAEIVGVSGTLKALKRKFLKFENIK
jgi:RNase P/RNase MRP subunit POP5